MFQPKIYPQKNLIFRRTQKLEPDFFCNICLGQILSQDVLDIPKYETINLHASLLPKIQGANPIQRAIINGDKETEFCVQ